MKWNIVDYKPNLKISSSIGHQMTVLLGYANIYYLNIAPKTTMTSLGH